jgi:uncharacterized membrane protein
MLSPSLAVAISDMVLRLLAAAVNFAVCGVCIYHLYVASRDLRWSRSGRRFVTDHPEFQVFWTRFVLAIVGSLASLSVGILILIPPAPRIEPIKFPNPDFIEKKDG